MSTLFRSLLFGRLNHDFDVLSESLLAQLSLASMKHDIAFFTIKSMSGSIKLFENDSV